MKSWNHIFLLIIGISWFFNSCNNGDTEETEPEPQTGNITFKFKHHVDGEPLILDSMMYVNAAKNTYEVNEVMYFISDVTLHKNDGSSQIIKEWKDIHYVDTDILSTQTWDVYDDIPIGSYDSISFVFGISEEKNQSFMFVDYPEVNMMWPDILGGGYHYMMINGSWLDESNLKQFYNFHLGIGQLYKGDVVNYDSIYAYVQNYFYVNLPNSRFTIQKDSDTEMEIVMNIESWFTTPHNFDFNYWGGEIMEVQPAMQMASENGLDVFTTGVVK